MRDTYGRQATAQSPSERRSPAPSSAGRNRAARSWSCPRHRRAESARCRAGCWRPSARRRRVVSAPPPCRRIASPARDRTRSERRRAAGGRARRSATPCRSSPRAAAATTMPTPPSRSTWPARASSRTVRLPPTGLRAFGDDDDAELRAEALALAESLRATFSRSYGISGNQNDVGAAGDAGVQRNPAGIAAHHLDHHDALVRFRRRVQAIDRVGRKRDRGVEAETAGRAPDVVVDGLRHADDGDALQVKLVRDLSVPSPPITTSASSPILLKVSTTRSE